MQIHTERPHWYIKKNHNPKISAAVRTTTRYYVLLDITLDEVSQSFPPPSPPPNIGTWYKPHFRKMKQGQESKGRGVSTFVVCKQTASTIARWGVNSLINLQQGSIKPQRNPFTLAQNSIMWLRKKQEAPILCSADLLHLVKYIAEFWE